MSSVEPKKSEAIHYSKTDVITSNISCRWITNAEPRFVKANIEKQLLIDLSFLIHLTFASMIPQK